MSPTRLLLAVGSCLVLVAGFVVYRDLTALHDENDRAGILSRGNVPLEDVPAEPSPFLEDGPPAGAPEHALLVEGENELPAFDLLEGEGADVEVLSGKAPPELPPSEEVAPVPLLTPQQRKEHIAAIREVLPDIPDERLEFWLEETRDLPPEMIRDMLMLRKHVGALSEPLGSDGKDIPDPPHVDPEPDREVSDPVRESLLGARSLVLQNQMNEDSIGYLATQLVFVEDRQGFPNGVRLAEAPLSLKPGNQLQTGRPLDVSFKGERTFLLVYEGESPRLTRYGRLMIGPRRHLQLAIAGTDLIVSPQIVIPEGIDRVKISGSGEILVPAEVSTQADENVKSLGQLELRTVPEPAYLQPVGSACYVPTERSGDITELVDEAQPGGTPRQDVLIPGTLQQSNVDPRDEEDRLRRIDRLLKLWETQKASTKLTLPAVSHPKPQRGMPLEIF